MIFFSELDDELENRLGKKVWKQGKNNLLKMFDLFK